MVALIFITVFLLFGVPGLLLVIAKMVGLNGPDRRNGRIIGYPLDVPRAAPGRSAAETHPPGAEPTSPVD
jgi:hypothetical protein